MAQFWTDNAWTTIQHHYRQWWQGEGLVLCVIAPRDEPHADITPPPQPETLEQAWLDPAYRAHQAEYELSRTFFGADAFPFFDTHIGPGNLATFLGSEPEFAEETVWYQHYIDDPENPPDLRFDPDNIWFQRQMAIVQRGVEIADGRFPVGMPDLVENLDILASLRDTSALLTDLIDHPDFVQEKIAEINPVYFAAFDQFYQVIAPDWDGNVFSAFRVWGPGKTAKVQCDASAMISPRMFKRFVLPALTEQCEWLDYAIYHLDGTQAMCHLDTLLAIEPLQAIEWTPQAGIEQGGHPRWYDLYRTIKAGGKSVQALGVQPDEVMPLLDAVRPDGMFVWVDAATETQARELIECVERDYR